MKAGRRFDRQKAIEVIKFIAKNTPNADFYWVGKILYFADRKHLARYGRLICGDDYVAMNYGPVPSGTYDIYKEARMFQGMPDFHPAHNEFEVQARNKVVALREPNLDLFSDSDLECLRSAIKKYGCMTFNQLKRASHDKAFESAGPNSFIDIEQLIATLPDSKRLLKYYRESSS